MGQHYPPFPLVPCVLPPMLCLDKPWNKADWAWSRRDLSISFKGKEKEIERGCDLNKQPFSGKMNLSQCKHISGYFYKRSFMRTRVWGMAILLLQIQRYASFLVKISEREYFLYGLWEWLCS